VAYAEERSEQKFGASLGAILRASGHRIAGPDNRR